MKRFNSLTAILVLAFGLLLSPESRAQLFNDMDKNPHDIVLLQAIRRGDTANKGYLWETKSRR